MYEIEKKMLCIYIISENLVHQVDDVENPLMSILCHASTCGGNQTAEIKLFFEVIF